MEIILPFLICALMGMGVGGGGLLVIYLTLYLALPQLSAQGTNLCLFVIVGAFSLLYHFKKGQVKIRYAIIMLALGVPGSILFSRLTVHINPAYPKVALGVLLIVCGASTLYNIIVKPIIKKFKKTLYK